MTRTAEDIEHAEFERAAAYDRATARITFATAAPITLTVSQMLTISISLGEAADWNAENDYPQHAAELRQLRVELRKQFRPFFDALDNEAVIGTIDRPKQDDLFNLAVDIARQQS